MKYNKLKLIELIGKDKHSYIEIGLRVKLHSNMVGRIVRGESIPSLESLANFATYYQKDINYFYDIESTSIVSSPVQEYGTNDGHYKALYELQKEINEVLKESSDLKMENAELKMENERLKNVNAPVQSANVG